MRIPCTRTTVVPALACIALLTSGAVAAAAAATPTTTPARAIVWISGNATVTARTAYKETIHGGASYHGTHLGGRLVVLQARRTGSRRWTSIRHTNTGAKSGAVTFVVTQSGRSEQYRLVLMTGKVPDATSGAITVHRG